MTNLHAKLSPSGAKKWMTCPGSVALEEGLHDSSEYSDEGTAAHALAAMCLQEGKHPSAYQGRILRVVDGVYMPNVTAGDNVREFEVDDEMVTHVATYVDSIRAYEAAGATAVLVEQRVPVGHVTGEEGATGTADVIMVFPNELQVHDLKYGRGVSVRAHQNPQGMMYLLGALETYLLTEDRPPDRFRFVIHQPRVLDAPDEWDCTLDDLMAFKHEAEVAAQDVWAALRFTDNWRTNPEAAYLTPGEHCRTCFCKARATCPALAKYVEDSVGADFEVLADAHRDPVAEEQVANEISVADADWKVLGRKAAAIDVIEDWCKAVRAQVERVLIGARNSDEACAALGFKLVQGKRGGRQWGDADEAEKVLKSMRLKSEQVYNYTLISPTQAEKLLKKETPKRWKRLEPLITQSDGRPHVAPVTDKRAALKLGDTAEDFSEVVDGSDLV